jgi:hypothetical protein
MIIVKISILEKEKKVLLKELREKKIIVEINLNTNQFDGKIFIDFFRSNRTIRYFFDLKDECNYS